MIFCGVACFLTQGLKYDENWAQWIQIAQFKVKTVKYALFLRFDHVYFDPRRKPSEAERKYNLKSYIK